jgi:hypothetical protein
MCLNISILLFLASFVVQTSAICQATVSCTGLCTCPSVNPSASGVISTTYSNNVECIWTIASSASANSKAAISLSFSSFAMENTRDFVTVQSCTSAGTCCTSATVCSTQIARSSANGGLSGPYTTTNGWMKIWLTSDLSTVGTGFASSWSVACQCDPGYTGPDGGSCAACQAGTYKVETGAAACTSCPTFTTSPAASTAVAACVNAKCGAGYTGPDGACAV